MARLVQIPRPLTGIAYDTRQEHGLLLAKEGPVDLAIREFLREFAAAADDRRSFLASRLTSQDNNSTLLHFSVRSAVFALRGDHTQHLTHAFEALAVARWEVRDPAPLPVVVAAIATSLGADLEALYDGAERLASGEGHRVLPVLREAFPKGLNLEESGYAVVETFRGPGLVDRASAPPQGRIAHVLWVLAKPMVGIPGVVLCFWFCVVSWGFSIAGAVNFIVSLLCWGWWRASVARRRWLTLIEGASVEQSAPSVLRRVMSVILIAIGVCLVWEWYQEIFDLVLNVKSPSSSSRPQLVTHLFGAVGVLLVRTGSWLTAPARLVARTS